MYKRQGVFIVVALSFAVRQLVFHAEVGAAGFLAVQGVIAEPVSYTHLDVYKRQRIKIPPPFFSDGIAVNPPAVFGVVKAVIEMCIRDRHEILKDTPH